MDQSFDQHAVTPEGVLLHIDTAGLGSRMIATLVDSSIQAVVGIALTLAVSLSDASFVAGTAGTITLVVGWFVLMFGYYPVLEGVWNGRTPGKRAVGLRVVQTDGQPVKWGAVAVRNLLRLVDFLPVYYGVGAIVMVLTRRSQRLGDLAAGTVVVREHGLSPPETLPPDTNEQRPPIDVAAMTEGDYEIVRSFLVRADSLVPAARQSVAAEIARGLQDRVSDPYEGGAPEAYLRAVAKSWRERRRGSG